MGWGGVLLLLIVKHVPQRGARNGLVAGSMPSCVFAVAGMASGPEEDEEPCGTELRSPGLPSLD